MARGAEPREQLGGHLTALGDIRRPSGRPTAPVCHMCPLPRPHTQQLCRPRALPVCTAHTSVLRAVKNDTFTQIGCEPTMGSGAKMGHLET
ncbi:hypothetical protein NDU88_010113 [Pleurodeles waltl]|uniref:Uncharacterized protein n=1 Tax=Pleurodeles waltl TaxID=8319 RepID=A0AAV7Q193_PLEWA|nr:hypothetical protein NDU88_010113 [Pleurodeles waltl]